MAVLEPQLDHPAYHQRVRLRGYNYATTIFQAVSDRDAARILRKTNPTWSSQDHLDLAAQHAEAATRHAKEWSDLVQEAAQETYGRPFRFEDYRISAIASDDFTPEKKERLRFAAHAETYHKLASRAHALAAKRTKQAKPEHRLTH